MPNSIWVRCYAPSKVDVGLCGDWTDEKWPGSISHEYINAQHYCELQKRCSELEVENEKLSAALQASNTFDNPLPTLEWLGSASPASWWGRDETGEVFMLRKYTVEIEEHGE